LLSSGVVFLDRVGEVGQNLEGELLEEDEGVGGLADVGTEENFNHIALVRDVKQ